MTSSDRLFSISGALDHSATVTTLCLIGGLLVFAPLLAVLLRRLQLIDSPLTREILVRAASWAVIVVLVIGPIMLGAFWAMLVFFMLAIGSYLEYARMTGLFRQRKLSWVVLLGIIGVFAAALDHWYGLFVALIPLGIILITAVGLVGDNPRGYVQRVALGVLGFLLFGTCLGHLAYFGNSPHYRALLLVILTATALNDVYAYTVGKLLGRRKLCPNISPNKTVVGALGALCMTMLTVVLLGQFLLVHSPLISTFHLALGGAILSVCGQLGDLMLSAIKRDIGIKDTGKLIPGHGGLLDRIDSLVLTAPACFHFVGYFAGIGLDQPTRIMTGGCYAAV